MLSSRGGWGPEGTAQSARIFGSQECLQDIPPLVDSLEKMRCALISGSQGATVHRKNMRISRTPIYIIINSIFPACSCVPVSSPLEDWQLRKRRNETQRRERKRALDFKDHRYYGMKGELFSTAGW